MIAKWMVTFPIVGTVVVEGVEAETEAEAIDRVDLGEAEVPKEPEQWEMVRQVTRGNVCHAPVNEAYAEEEGE